jgi:hypothetical protein
MTSETRSPALDLVGEPAPGLLSFGVHQRRKDLVVSSTRSPESKRPQPDRQLPLTQPTGAFGPIAAKIAARSLFEAATIGDQRAIARAKDQILHFASIARSPSFVEMLVGELTLAGLEHNAPHACCGYLEAEFSARCALQKIIPELRVTLNHEGGNA